MILLSTLLWHPLLPPCSESITLQPYFPHFAVPQLHQECSLVDPPAWSTLSQIGTGLTSSFIQIFVQMSSYQKSLPWPICGKHTPLFSQLPHHSLHPYSALFLSWHVNIFCFPQLGEWRPFEDRNFILFFTLNSMCSTKPGILESLNKYCWIQNSLMNERTCHGHTLAIQQSWPLDPAPESTFLNTSPYYWGVRGRLS